MCRRRVKVFWRRRNNGFCLWFRTRSRYFDSGESVECQLYNVARMSDDFSEQVKRVLSARVGNLCSNPDCGILTSGPQIDPAKAINLGVAAHITAASPGGPRYDAELLAEERSAPGNGIWLCQTCGKLDSSRQVDIPKSFIETVHSWGDTKPALVLLKGRLQWVSRKRNFELFPEMPPEGRAGVYGIGKDVDSRYVQQLGIPGRSSFVREERLPQLLSQGWYVYYDVDGTYLKWLGPDVDQIVIVDWV